MAYDDDVPQKNPGHRRLLSNLTYEVSLTNSRGDPTVHQRYVLKFKLITFGRKARIEPNFEVRLTSTSYKTFRSLNSLSIYIYVYAHFPFTDVRFICKEPFGRIYLYVLKCI